MSATVHSLHPVRTAESLPADYTQGWNDGKEYGERESAVRHRFEGGIFALSVTAILLFGILFVSFATGCADTAAMPSAADVAALNSGALADAIAAAKPGVPR